MIDAYDPKWSDEAVEDLLALPLDRAEAVDRAVQRFAKTGEGYTLRVAGQVECRLVVGDLVVVLFVDESAHRVHVDRIRARRR